MSEDRTANLLFILFVLAVLFSVQFPLPNVGSKFASLNVSDLVLVCIGGLFLLRRTDYPEWNIRLFVPEVTLWFLVVTGWIIITVAVAVLRSSVSLLPNALWVLKWLEIGVFLFLSQSFAERIAWSHLFKFLLGGGALIGTIAAFRTITAEGTYTQATVLWQNPNTMAVFLVLPALLGLLNGAMWFKKRPRRGLQSLGPGSLCLLGVLTTGSRSGIIALVIGALTCTILLYGEKDVRLFTGSVFGGALIVGSVLYTLRPWLFSRYIPLELSDGGIVINQVFIGGLNSRFRLTREAIELWQQQPIFGYGWFASPENPMVGYLDVLYTQLLVDLGIVGFVLISVFYLEVVRGFVRRRVEVSRVVPTVGAGWVVGLLVAGIGGAHARVPRLMFLFVLLLVGAAALASSGRESFWA